MTQRKTSIDTIASSCIAGRLRILNRVITNIYDDALRPFGIKISQGNILIVTGRLGIASPGQICDFLQLDVSTLSRNVEVMRKNGWLETVPGNDARSHRLRLTPQGKRLIEQVTPAWEEAQKQARKLLGDGLVAEISDAAQRLSGPQGN